MLQLTASYSDALAELIRADDAPIDGIEVGPWFTPKQIRGFQLELPHWGFQFHASSFISRVRYFPGSLKRLRQYLACTHSQWLSVHIEILPLQVYLLSTLWGLDLKPPRNNRTRNGFIRALEKVKGAIEIPLILENLPSLPGAQYAYGASPENITEIIATAGAGFLLDIAHARAAASYQGMTVYEYLEQLPLEKTKQVHISGVRKKDGILRDAHEPLQEVDYAILKWVLERSQPIVLTLEYFRDRDKLREQLWRLREAIAN